MSKKITEEQLKKVNKSQETLSALVNQIGILETQKHGLLHQVAEANKELEEVKAELEAEYGPVNINLKTGEYETIEEDAKLEKA